MSQELMRLTPEGLIKAASEATLVDPGKGLVIFAGRVMNYEQLSNVAGWQVAQRLYSRLYASNAPAKVDPKEFFQRTPSRNGDEPPMRIDLMRRCAVELSETGKGMPWAACYVRARGSWTGSVHTFDASAYEYSGSIKITKELYYGQYHGKQQSEWANEIRIGEERCARCGAVENFGNGGVFQCGACGSVICAGLSTGRYMRCFCGSEGWAADGKIQQVGVAPGL